MPLVRRKLKPRRGPSEAQINALLTGHQYHFGDALDEDGLRDLWVELRDELLVDFIWKNVGKRPWAWWRFQSPGRRERIGTSRHIPRDDDRENPNRPPLFETTLDDAPHPFDDPVRRKHIERIAEEQFDSPADRKQYLAGAYEISFGTPSVLCIKSDGDAVYETQAVFLDRHDLLLAEERAALAIYDLADEDYFN